jgi:hypothetical protein
VLNCPRIERIVASRGAGRQALHDVGHPAISALHPSNPRQLPQLLPSGSHKPLSHRYFVFARRLPNQDELRRSRIAVRFNRPGAVPVRTRFTSGAEFHHLRPRTKASRPLTEAN